MNMRRSKAKVSSHLFSYTQNIIVELT